MEQYEHILVDHIIREVLTKIQINSAELVELKCYQAIRKIHDILSNEELDDPDCFRRIEEIVCVLDELGVGGGGRHDF